jgi:proteasome lid subunit RPN8/RPN11
MVEINKELLDKLIEHAQKSYPYESCGILVGQPGKIMDVNFVENKIMERKRDRYEIDPGDFLKVDKLTREKGQEIIGFYHSHPDHPALPSDFDIEHAWPEYIYIIISVVNGNKHNVKAWKLFPDNKKIKEEELNIK